MILRVVKLRHNGSGLNSHPPLRAPSPQIGIREANNKESAANEA